MKTITVASIKGGSGKTTLVQVLASAALNKGKRVHMIDADADRQLLEWQHKASVADYGNLERVPWPEALTVASAPASVDDLYDQINDLSVQGIDYLLIDTRPGEAPETENLILAADVALVPVRPVQADFVSAARTITWISKAVETVEDGHHIPVVATVISNAEKKAVDYFVAPDDRAVEHALQKVHLQDKEVYIAVDDLPNLPTILPASSMLQRMPLSGPLTYAHAMYAQDPGKRLQAAHFKAALEHCEAVLEDIDDMTEQDNGE